MQYAFIENAAIADGPRALPASWRHIVGLPNLADAQRAELGWLPVERDPLGDYQRHAAPIIGDSEVYYPAVDIGLAELQQRKQAEIDRICEQAMQQLTADTPAAEISTWDQQAAEAGVWQAWSDAGADANAPPATPLLSALAAGRGITLADLVARVQQKTGMYAQAVGTLVGQRQAGSDTIAAIAADDSLDEATARTQLLAVGS